MGRTRDAMAMLVVFGLVMAVAQGAKEGAPTPAPDCSSVLLDMSACLSYVQNGSKESKPDGACCQGLEKVMKKNAKCLCEVLKESGNFGIALNMTRATELPAACKIDAPPALKECAGSESPAPSPPPKTSPPSKAAPSPSKAAPPTFSNLTQSPAPSPAQSEAQKFLPSTLVLSAAMAMIWFSN